MHLHNCFKTIFFRFFHCILNVLYFHEVISFEVHVLWKYSKPKLRKKRTEKFRNNEMGLSVFSWTHNRDVNGLLTSFIND